MKLLIAESRNFSEQAIKLLRSEFEVQLEDLDRDGLLEQVKDVEILWVRLRIRIDREIMQAGVNLKAVVTNTTGLTHIDVEEAERRGISVLSLKGETQFLEGVRATAEHTLSLLLALARRLPAAVEHVRMGGWNRDEFRGRELFGKTAVVVGYGRLGRIVARYFMALGMDVLVVDPTPGGAENGVTILSLQEALPRADVVSLHVSLSKETEKMFGEKEFKCLKDGALFVNTARGELVDEGALLKALESGQLAGAALDVLKSEVDLDVSHHPLVKYAQKHNNLIITPHIGGNTVQSWEKTELFMTEKLIRWLKGS